MDSENKFEDVENRIPEFADRQEMWAKLKVERVSGESSSLQEYANAIRAVYVNGAVRCAIFRVAPHNVFDWYASRNQFHEMGFFSDFWKLAAVKSILDGRVRDLNFFDHSVFAWSSPFLLGGRLAEALAAGGAYQRHRQGCADAKRLGEAAAVELIHDDYDQTLVYESHVAWADFFCDVAWDRTWLIFNKQARLLTLIIATDSD